MGIAMALDEAGPISALSIREETFSLPIADAYELLHASSSDVDTYAKVTALMKAGKAKIERLLILRTKSGQRAVVESIDELRYAIEYNVAAHVPAPPPPAGSSVPKTPEPARTIVTEKPYATTFETRNVGDTLEIEPVIGPDGVTIDLNLVPQSVRFAGYQQPTGESWVQQPLFETQKLTTGVSVSAGEPYLLGTLNPPFGNSLAMEKTEHRIWLDFLTVDIVPIQRPELKSKILDVAKAITIPKLDFREATLTEALEFLRSKSRDLDPRKEGINFVLKVPPSFSQVKITISLINVPLLEAVKYITNLASLEFSVEENALVVHPKGERF